MAYMDIASPATASVVSVANANVAADPSSSNSADVKKYQELKSTNELYAKYSANWAFYQDAFTGGKSFAKRDNLFKHTREHPDDFDERAKRVYYHNYCSPLVSFFTDFIFAETIQREAGQSDQDFYTAFINDVNKKGENVTAFMSQVSDLMQVFGMVYVLVDAPRIAAPMTAADEKAQGIRPYWVLISPFEVLDWVTDDFDNYIYLKRCQRLVTVDQGTMVKKTIDRFTEWTQGKIKITDVDITDGEERPKVGTPTIIDNSIGSVPIVPVRYKRSKEDPYIGQSFLTDIAYISREVMNLTSLLQEFLYRQCFNILAIPQDPNVQETEAMQGEIGTSNSMRYAQGTDKPGYITPPVDPAKFLQDERQRCIEAMYRISAEDTLNELFNGGKASGFSKSQSFRTSVPKIATRADVLEKAENNLMVLTMKFRSSTWKGTVKYKDHYEITNLTDALTQMTSMFKDLQIQSKTFASAQMKRIVHEFDGKLSADDLKKVYDEIDATDWDEWFDTQKLAFIGRAAMSPETATAFGSDSAPVKGKDTATAASTPQRGQSTSAEIQSESTKQPKQ